MSEGYGPGWKHAMIHLNEKTGEMHSDGDHSVRHWIESRIKREQPSDLEDRDGLTDEQKEDYRRQRQLNAEREAKLCPSVVMIMKPVDGGRACIGMIECPHCGSEHLTTQIKCGELSLFCGLNEDGDTIGVDGQSRVMVERIV